MKENSATPKKPTASDLLRFFVIFLLISFLSFGLGRLSAIEENKDPVKIEYDLRSLPEGVDKESSAFEERVDKEVGSVVTSKNGRAFHLPWCPGAKRINEENKVWFSSAEEAEEAGYAPAKNCKGLE
ncbi:MAG: Ada metal-binding domain-containing protein [Patescibacteria group bacterium]